MTLSVSEIEQKFTHFVVWRRKGERAVHKPLLILYALAKLQQGAPRMIPYKELDKPLKQLLIDFGPSRKHYHTEYPFWRLQNDGVWELSETAKLEKRQSNTDAKKSELYRYNVAGGFSNEIYEELKHNQSMLNKIADSILSGHFPASLHDDILQAIGLDLSGPNTMILQRRRDPNFRPRVLRAYEYQCAVCGFSMRVGDSLVGLEAAHIKWHQAGGPDTEDNGLALCSLHHALFDRGVFTLAPCADMKIQVSQSAHGSPETREAMLRYHGCSIFNPQSPDFFPKETNVRWHNDNVFHTPARC